MRTFCSNGRLPYFDIWNPTRDIRGKGKKRGPHYLSRYLRGRPRTKSLITATCVKKNGGKRTEVQKYCRAFRQWVHELNITSNTCSTRVLRALSKRDLISYRMHDSGHWSEEIWPRMTGTIVITLTLNLFKFLAISTDTGPASVCASVTRSCIEKGFENLSIMWAGAGLAAHSPPLLPSLCSVEPNKSRAKEIFARQHTISDL